MKTRYKANVETIESQNRFVTSEEQSIMTRYVGWGGIPQAFDSKNNEWSNEYNELKSLLTDDEYNNAKSWTLTSFYTLSEVIDEMYQALN